MTSVKRYVGEVLKELNCVLQSNSYFFNSFEVVKIIHQKLLDMVGRIKYVIDFIFVLHVQEAVDLF